MKTIQSTIHQWWNRLSAGVTTGKAQLTTQRTAPMASLILTIFASLLQLFVKLGGVPILVTLLTVWLLSTAALKPFWKIVFIAWLLIFVIPVSGIYNAALTPLMVQMFIYIALALGLNLVVGFTGLLDLGYIAFFAGGAYVYSIFGSGQAANFLPWFATHQPNGFGGWWFWVAIPIAIAVAALLGLALGMPVLRMRGDYLAIVTLGFGEVVQVIARNMDHPINITGGAPGISDIAKPSFFGLSLGGHTGIYFVGLLFMLLTAIAMYRLQLSRVGRAWAAMREDDVAARAMGIPLVKMKLLAFATGASFSGAMGMLFAVKQQFINPDTFGFMESIGILAMIILGGLGSIRGVIVGAAAVTLLRFQFLRDLSDFFATKGLPPWIDITKYQPMIFGLILVVMMIYRQEGLVPATRPMEDIAALEEPDAEPTSPGKSKAG
jgi:branched-chain amino acid transport system permease protein